MQEKELQHIAIIMDGNRRWAKEHNLDEKIGHKEGAKTLENIVRYANKIGIKYITVYAFSTENWKRSRDEVGALMILLQNYFLLSLALLILIVVFFLLNYIIHPIL